MNSASVSTIAPQVNLHEGWARRLRIARRTLLARRGTDALAGVVSGSTFLLVRVPAYTLVLLFAAAACLTGVLLYGLRSLVYRLSGGVPQEAVGATPAAQMLAGGGSHG
jgi:hypothetical protein